MMAAKSATWSYLKRAWDNDLIFARASRSLAKTALCWKLLGVKTRPDVPRRAKTHPRRHQDVPRCAKTVPRRLQNSDGPRFWWVLAAKRPQEASKTAQEAPKRPPRPPQVAPRWPTWVQVGFQNGAKIEEKSMEKSIENVMHLGIDFWKDCGGFLDET